MNVIADDQRILIIQASFS